MGPDDIRAELEAGARVRADPPYVALELFKDEGDGFEQFLPAAAARWLSAELAKAAEALEEAGLA